MEKKQHPSLGRFSCRDRLEDKQKMMRKESEDAADDIARNLIKDAAEVKKMLDEKRVLNKSDREWIVNVLKGNRS